MPQNRMHQLLPHKALLNMKQKNYLLHALQIEKVFPKQPTKTQRGGFFDTLLASLGIPLAVEAIKKLTGKGAPRIGQKTFKNK